MTEDQTQVTEPVGPGSQPEGAQPSVSPSTEAAPVAAPTGTEPGPTQPSTEELLKRLEKSEQRRHSQQSVLDQARIKAQREAQQYQQQLGQMQARMDELETRGMDETAKKAFLAQRERERAIELEQQLEQERRELEGQKNYFGWLDYYVRRGVPLDVIKDSADFADMHERVLDYFEKNPAKAGAPPSSEPIPPRVTPSDQVHGGGVGTPTIDTFAKARADGVRPGTPEYREMRKRMIDSGEWKKVT